MDPIVLSDAGYVHVIFPQKIPSPSPCRRPCAHRLGNLDSRCGFVKLVHVDGLEIPNNHRLDGAKTLVNSGITRWWFQNILIFSSRKLGKIPILTNICSDGLKPPTR